MPASLPPAITQSDTPAAASAAHQRPQLSAVLELLKPITWFPPMWAFLCGAISSGQSLTRDWLLVIAGIILAGPLVCAMSQAVNDWFDRDVDAINEPHRPIPSGRMPGQWGLYVAWAWTVLSLLWAAALGQWVLGATVVGLAFAWAYSAPPLRLKLNGWWGNTAVAVCYEGLPWITGAAVLAAGEFPAWPLIAAASLYSLGAHGIMTLNDFKAIEGDRRMGVRSLPVQLGVMGAARTAWGVMAVAQFAVVGLLLWLDRPIQAAVVMGLIIGQAVLARRFLADPVAKATWFSALAVALYVSGMMVTAFALASLNRGGAL
ncbi:MAG: chlorophyll synthase ChlG [Burkholderiales bacterium]|nr:chlorophyll synthase ChlG [Burkholderiales bacterium]